MVLLYKYVVCIFSNSSVMIFFYASVNLDALSLKEDIDVQAQ